MEFKEVVKNRYSCKKFSDRQVENEKQAGRERKADSDSGSGEAGPDGKEPAGTACLCGTGGTDVSQN